MVPSTAFSAQTPHALTDAVEAAITATAAAEQQLERLWEHCTDRRAFGSALHGHQGVRLQLAELRLAVERSQCLNDAAAAALRRGSPALVADAAHTASELVRRVAEESLELHGAVGYLTGHPASKFAAQAPFANTALQATPHSSDVDPTDEDLLALHLDRDAKAAAALVRGRASALGDERLVREVVAPLFSDVFPVRAVLRTLADLRLLGLGFPADFGGVGGDVWQVVALLDVLAGVGPLALATTALSHLEVGTRLVVDHGSRALAEAWVPAALRGEAVIGYAATEAGAGSDVASTVTKAYRRGERWLLRGAKKYITNAVQADALCVLARTSERDVVSHTLFLVPMDAPGVSRAALHTLGNSGTLGEAWFDDVELSDDTVLGQPGQGLLLQIRRLTHERALLAVVLGAAAQHALEQAASASPAHEVRRLRRLVLGARCLAYAAVRDIDVGRGARVRASLAKVACRRALLDVARQWAEVEAGRAQPDPAAGRLYRDALGFALAGGTDTMLLESVAR